MVLKPNVNIKTRRAFKTGAEALAHTAVPKKTIILSTMCLAQWVTRILSRNMQAITLLVKSKSLKSTCRLTTKKEKTTFQQTFSLRIIICLI